MTAMRTRGLILTSAAMLALAALAGCSQSQPEATTNEVVENTTATNVAAPARVVSPPVTNLAENASDAVPVPPDKPVPVDQQTLDDASATGMTSHVSRDQETPPPPAN
jgi:hypothetical protein